MLGKGSACRGTEAFAPQTFFPLITHSCPVPAVSASITSICKDLQKYLHNVPAQVMFLRLTVMHITVPALLGTVEYTVQNLQNVHTWTATNATASFKMEKTAKNKVFNATN